MSFESGDIVKLKSGGPEMTVQGVGQMVTCQWFAGKKLEVGRFNPNSLEYVEEEEQAGCKVNLRKMSACIKMMSLIC